VKPRLFLGFLGMFGDLLGDVRKVEFPWGLGVNFAWVTMLGEAVWPTFSCLRSLGKAILTTILLGDLLGADLVGSVTQGLVQLL
jgi:hypothetical protein